jgi:drug/metabolite transporter (DMT)-like permease
MSIRKLGIDANTLAGLLAILLWSTTVALVRSLAEKVGPLTAAAAVYLIGGVLCSGYLLKLGSPIKRIQRLPCKYLLGCGGLFVLYMFLLFLSIGLATDRCQVLEVGLLNYLWPALTVLFSLLFLNKKANVFLVPGTLFALAGIFLVLTQSSSISWMSFWRNIGSNPIAYSLALTAAISWALYSNLTRRWAGPMSDSGIALFMPAAGLVLLIFRLMNTEHASWNIQAVVEVLFLGLATALAYALWDIAMRKGDVVLVAACSYFTPLLSTLVSCIYLGIKARRTLWLGCILIVIGSILSWASVSSRKCSEAT